MNFSQTCNRLKLKVKAKSLAAESRIIRKEERQLYELMNNNEDFREGYVNDLHEHRVVDVRNEARATHIVRALLAGKSYTDIERTRKDAKEYSFWCCVAPRVITIAKKYGGGIAGISEMLNVKKATESMPSDGNWHEHIKLQEAACNQAIRDWMTY